MTETLDVKTNGNSASVPGFSDLVRPGLEQARRDVAASRETVARVLLIAALGSGQPAELVAAAVQAELTAARNGTQIASHHSEGTGDNTSEQELSPDMVDITRAEHSVMGAMGPGLSNAEIARLLGVKVSTVKYHLGNIYPKLGVKNRTQAIAAYSALVSDTLQEPSDLPLPGLSNRENQVIELLSQGLSNSQIATELDITEQGIKFHVTNIFNKLGVSTRAEAATAWRQARQTPIPELNGNFTEAERIHILRNQPTIRKLGQAAALLSQAEVLLAEVQPDILMAD